MGVTPRKRSKPAKPPLPTNSDAALARSRELSQANRHGEAAELLRGALEADPENPERACEYGTLLCYLQREDEAVRWLERSRGAEGYERLGRILRRYFHCRALMAQRLGVPDTKGVALGARVEALFPRPPTDCGITLSACLIVRNEQANLERCLNSIVGRVDEIVVVDTGSSDRTLEIAEAYGATVGHFEWNDDFAAARNESLRLATGHWVLWIDADEEVHPASWNAIAEGLIRPQFGGYYVTISNLMDEEGRAQYVHSPVRIFQRLPGVQFEGRIHEQVLQCFERWDLPCARLENARIIHHGYKPEAMRERNKADRTIRMLEREVAETPTDAFHWFNLANAYSVARRREDAIRAARRCLTFIHPENTFGSLAFQILASALTVTGRPEEALQACEEAERRGFHTILTEFERAHALLRLERFEEALAAIESCQSMEWPAGMTGDYGIVTHKAIGLKGQILSGMGRLEEAEACFAKALSVDPGFPAGIYARAVNHERRARFAEALEEMEKVFPDLEFGHAARRAAARIALATGDHATAKVHLEAAFRVNPEDTDAWAQWATLAEDQGDPAECIRCYEAFAERHQPNSDVLVNWGRAWEALGDAEKAGETFARALQADPSNANAWFNAGDFLYRLGHFAEAAEVYRTALRLHPENAEGWFVLGNALARMGVGEGARIAYGQVLALCPEHAGARNNLATVSTSAA